MVQPGHRTWPRALPHLLHDPKKLPAPEMGCLNALWTWNRKKGIITEMGGSRRQAPATQPYHQSYIQLGRKKTMGTKSNP